MDLVFKISNKNFFQIQFNLQNCIFEYLRGLINFVLTDASENVNNWHRFLSLYFVIRSNDGFHFNYFFIKCRKKTFNYKCLMLCFWIKKRRNRFKRFRPSFICFGNSFDTRYKLGNVDQWVYLIINLHLFDLNF